MRGHFVRFDAVDLTWGHAALFVAIVVMVVALAVLWGLRRRSAAGG